MRRRRLWIAGMLAVLVAAAAGVVSPARSPGVAAQGAQSLDLPRVQGATPRHIVFILSDDHRYDAMGFMGHPFLQTPSMDRIARAGVHVRNAFVTTALCSPSRATILTGRYAHQHRVVDNNNPVPAGTVFFPQYLQRAGYETAFVGKWHMGGEGDDPQPGFDHWVSFRGQGSYLPSKDGLNVNGKRVPQKGYISDELTDYALEWLKGRSGDKPIFLYLSHKGVHAEFVPADRHKGRYAGVKVKPPASQSMPAELEARRPMWARNQRSSWHGVDYPYHSTLDIEEYYKRYSETLLGVDDSIGRVLDHLQQRGWLESTLVVYMGDNGFAFGEHGLIDKRTAYEESMRVPMLMQCPQLFGGGGRIEQVVANLDLAPTVLAAAGLQAPAHMVGANVLPLARGEKVPWREGLLYEYYWERNFPHTPTIFAWRGDRYKFVRYHGLWDVDELFDLQSDPGEMRNLIADPAHAARARELSDRMFKELAATDGLTIPLWPDRGPQFNLRRPGDTEAADFPPSLVAGPK